MGVPASPIQVNDLGGSLPQVTERIIEQEDASPGTSRCRWQSVGSHPKHEMGVAQELKARGIEAFAPLRNTVHCWKNHRKVQIGFPLFPGCLSVRIDQPDPLRVVRLAGVVTIVGSPNSPWPLPDCFAKAFSPVGSNLCLAVGLKCKSDLPPA